MALWTRVLIALVVGNGLAYAAYTRFKTQSGEAPARADVPEIAETKISFASTPSGAKVSEQGVVLGVTPFIRTYPRTASGQAREFMFELEGHSPAKVQAFLDQERIYVHTSLGTAAAVVQAAASEVAKPVEVEKVVAERVERPVERPVERTTHRRNRARETREVPRVQDAQAAVTKLDDDAREVPKLDDRRTGAPKVTDDETTPKMIDDEPSVEKLDDKDGKSVPKMDDDTPTRSSKSGRKVPKLKE